MKYEQEVRRQLIDNTIRLIGQGGFEKATTKEIAHSGVPLPNVRMNEIYIYRLFGSKEGLYSVVFARLDEEIAQAIFGSIKSHEWRGDDTQRELYALFDDAWRFILSNEERCRCYIRYYYSIYFRGESLKKHNQLFDGIINTFAPYFKEEADVKAILHSVFTAMLDFAVQVYNGDLENNELNAKHAFNVLYCMMLTYFREERSVIKNVNGL